MLTASGCGTTVREYGDLLADDARYAEKAARVSAMAQDIAEVVAAENIAALPIARTAQRFAVHCPCSLQHGQKFGDRLETLLSRLGLRLAATGEKHLCCGSAGSYSLLQPALSERLRARKVAALLQDRPDAIVTANVGCQLHLASGTNVPVMHWIEALDAACETPETSK